jgi:hypothetical protein
MAGHRVQSPVMNRDRARSLITCGGLASATLVLSHEVVYLVAYGPGDGYKAAMQVGGHDDYWLPYLLAVTFVVAMLGALAARELILLGRLAARADVSAVLGIEAEAPPFRVAVGSLWLRLAVAAGTAFVLQENLEVAIAGLEPSGLAVLGSHHGLALPVLLGTSLVVALVGALLRWRRAVLLSRIRAAGRRTPARPSIDRPITTHHRAPRSGATCGNGVRGPPRRLPQPT